MNKQLIITQINKRDAWLHNRIDQINNLLNIHKPHIFIINELNLHPNDIVSQHSFQNYKLLTDNLSITDSYSRTGMLVHNSIQFKRRPDLEGQGISTIWVQLTQPGRKPILIQALYRQFQRIGHKNTLSISEQKKRWNLILTKWETAALEDKEIISLGDFNLNRFSWNRHPAERTPYEILQAPLVKMLQDRILDNGFVVINSQQTKEQISPQDKKSCLDLIITNRKDKIINHETISPTFSDHFLLKMKRKTKGIVIPRQYIKTRCFQNFSKATYQENIINHPEYINTFYEKDPNRISEGIQKIIQDSLDPLAPVRRIQLTNKNSNKLSEEARELLALRDATYQQYLETKNQDKLREFRNLKNTANKKIYKERFDNKVKNFQKEGTTIKEKWNQAKKETGQKKMTTPNLIIEGQKHNTTPKEIAESMNRQYIQNIRKLIQNMPPQRTNPIENYIRHLGPNQDKLSFTFKNIAMSDLRQTLNSMRTTGSTAGDNISVKSIKQAREQLNPLILNLINRVISTGIFPEKLKITKVIPIEKPEKDKNTTEGWRPINLVCSLSKIIEKVLIKQLLQHLEDNKILSHSHHGAVRSKSTQTLVLSIYDKLLELVNQGQEAALVLLDQSKAYNLVQHSILLQKLAAIGLKDKSLTLMEDFLSERKQFVQIQGFESGQLLIGPQSVVQGSTMSCLLYLLYILDLPTSLHTTNHTPQEQINCPEPSLDTYVDDNYIVVAKRNNENIKEAIKKTMEKLTTTQTRTGYN